MDDDDRLEQKLEQIDQCIAEAVWWAATNTERTPDIDAKLVRFLHAAWREYLRRRDPPDDD